MKDMVFLEYTFMFDPAKGWSHLYQFENDLAKFFRGQGMEAEIVKTVEGQTGRRVIVLQPITMPLPEAPKNPKPGQVQKQVNKLREGK